MSSASRQAMSGGGRGLDAGVRRTLEHSLGVDLSAVRVHTGPAAQRRLEVEGVEAAAIGAHVLLANDIEVGSERWLHILGHEVAHTVQQAQGVRSTGPIWEVDAERAARRVLAGTAVSDRCLIPPQPGRGGVLQGFNSWEHRLLGDVSSADMVLLATRAGNWKQVLRKQQEYLLLWKDGAGVTAEAIRAVVPDVGLVTLPGSGCLATYGEVNALADFAPSVASLIGLNEHYIFAFLQQIRQQGYGRLMETFEDHHTAQNFAGAITQYYYVGDHLGDPIETYMFDKFTLALGVDHYDGQLARNACHFAPFSWYRWRKAHLAARKLATQAHQASDSAKRDQLTNLAWITQGFADHAIEDSFAAGHLANKTWVMQWFADWVKDHRFIPVLNWNAVRRITADLQPGLIGKPLYTRGYAGPSNDPQTAEEQPTFQKRMEATGIQAAAPETQVEAYHQYFAFLQASVVELASNQVHNHYNENSLRVASVAHPEPYQIYGDESLLRDGASIAIVSDTVHASQGVITQILQNGKTSTTPQDILDKLPTSVVEGNTPVALLEWHETVLSNVAPTLFGGLKAGALGILSPSLGLVSVDQESTGLDPSWQESLRGSGHAIVNPLWDGERLFAASYGTVYELDPKSGDVRKSIKLSGESGHEPRMVSDGHTLFVGVNGWMFGIDIDTFEKVWDHGLTGSGYEVVNVVLTDDGHLYAGSNGFVYELDPVKGKILARQGLTGLGNQPVSLAIFGDVLAIGTWRYVVALDRHNGLSKLWHDEIDGGGKIVDVVAVGDKLYAGSNGHIGIYDSDGKNLVMTWLSPGVTALVTDGKNAYASAKGFVGRFEYETEVRNRWDVELSNGDGSPTNMVSDGHNLFATHSGVLYQLDPASGQTQNVQQLDLNGSEARMTTDGAMLYVGITGTMIGLEIESR